MTDRIRIRRDTAANWTSANPTLGIGELGGETDTGRLKMGNGATSWTGLPYVDSRGYTPSGGISATTLAGAIAELDTEKAPLASPVFTGNPQVPTASPGDNDTTAASTAFVTAAVAAGGGGGGGGAVTSAYAATSGAGDITLTAPSSFTDITGLSVSPAAAVGDVLLITAIGSIFNDGSGRALDFAVVVAGTVKQSNVSASTAAFVAVPISVQWRHTVVSGDLSGGSVAVKVQGKASAGNLYIANSSGRQATLSVLNLGH